ncbi:MAG: tyrosine--tRNA ligase [Actinomycetota bacterium]|jgi:tyrosyl-tRNA synthetase|nr:tyrosine--tRNA ligase [Actinomycetota bacterium]MDD5600970.1 tyrosine--tRNA ligase [Actinomycetota bacterium]
MEKDFKRQIEIIESGTEDVLTKEELESRVKKAIIENKPLKVKLGLDPTAPDIHLGHAVVLNKLRQFQELGHKAILIIGDYTSRIGDPSGRSTLRPKLSEDVIEKNSKTYMEQAFKILIPEKTEVVKNSNWLHHLKFEDILNLTSRFTVARMLEREDFKKRYKSNTPIAIMEFLYPIMQAYDSVAVKADVELGGTDQKFNLLMGRELQKELGQEPQIAITMPILVGTDGVEKMSKSLGNYIGVYEPPGEIFGKIMSIPDNIIIDYFRLLTTLDYKDIEAMNDDMEKGVLNPSIAKRRLAKIIIERLYSKEEAIKAEEEFDLIFKKKEAPEKVEEYVIKQSDTPGKKIGIVELLYNSGLVSSKGEARRLIVQGGIKVDDKKVSDPDGKFNLDDLNNKILKRGKRFFRKIIVKE